MVTDIPELRHHIAQYLDFATLKAFTVVCKAWHLDAQPILWSRFKYEVPEKCSVSQEEYADWLDTIRMNAETSFTFGTGNLLRPRSMISCWADATA